MVREELNQIVELLKMVVSLMVDLQENQLNMMVLVVAVDLVECIVI